MTSNDTWLTLAQASNRHGKSIATIRRWITLNPVTVRTELRQGTRYVHEDDIAKVAAAFPPPVPPPSAPPAPRPATAPTPRPSPASASAALSGGWRSARPAASPPGRNRPSPSG